MPVETRSNAHAKNIQRDEQSAVKGLIKLSLIHPDRLTPPTSPVVKNVMHPPPPLRRSKNMYIDTSISKMTEAPSPPVLRKQNYYGRYALNTLVDVNTKSIISELKRSTQRFITLLDELEQEYD